jgi:hypothetical protein
VNGIGGTGTAVGPLTEPELLRGYAPAAAPADRTVQAVVTLNLLETRISELLSYRAWYRQHRWAEWSDLRLDNERELRALLRLARRGRRIAAAGPDPVDAYKGWQETELREAFGR